MKTKTKIQIGIIIVVYTLITMLAFSNPDCSKCVVEFKNHKVSGVVMNLPPIVKNMTDLYESFKLNKCPVIWTKTQGYVYG